MAFALRYEKTLIPIRGDLVIGRSSQCQVLIDSERVSRRHARISLTADGLSLEDLGSANGVFLNGSPIAGRCRIRAGDRIVIGDRPMEIVELRDSGSMPREERNTLVGMRRPDLGAPVPDAADLDDGSYGSATAKGDSMSLLGAVVEKLLDENDIESAERLMNVRMRAVLSEVETGGGPANDVELRFTRLVLRLAEKSRRAHWIGFLLDFYRAAKRAMPLEAVQKLYDLVPALGQFDASKLTLYLNAMNQVPRNSTDRFALQRLEALASMLKKK